MARFSAVDAAFSGFGFIKAHPRAVLIWTGFYVLAVALQAGLGFALTGVGYVELFLAPSQIPQAEQLRVMLAALPGLLLFCALCLGLYAAIQRALFSGPTPGPLAGLRFGWREAGIVVVGMVVGLAVVAVYLVGFGTAFVLFIPKQPVLSVIGVVLGVATFSVGIWIGVRLSLAMPVWLLEGVEPFSRSWALTRRRFWPLLGAYLLIAVVLALAELVLNLIFAVPLLLMMIAQGGGLDFVLQMLTHKAVGLTPDQLLLLAVPFVARQLLEVCLIALQTAPMVEAYRAFSAEALP